MIPIQKSKKPTILVINETNWKTELLEAIQNQDKEKEDIVSKRYNHPTVKETLEKDFHNKCGYCENKLKVSDYGHIDHFCPQKISPADTFDWDNLILSCSMCNSKAYKGDKFPIQDITILLIHPCIDNPNNHLRFQYDKLGETALVDYKDMKGRVTIEVLGLNRPELLKERSKYIFMILSLIEKSASSNEAKALLNEAQADTEKFSAFVKTLHHYFDF